MQRYRIVRTPDWGLRLTHGGAGLADLPGNRGDAETLRRMAEEHAGAELDWRGGTVRECQRWRNMPTLWEADCPVAPLPAAV